MSSTPSTGGLASGVGGGGRGTGSEGRGGGNRRRRRGGGGRGGGKGTAAGTGTGGNKDDHVSGTASNTSDGKQGGERDGKKKQNKMNKPGSESNSNNSSNIPNNKAHTSDRGGGGEKSKRSNARSRQRQAKRKAKQAQAKEEIKKTPQQIQEEKEAAEKELAEKIAGEKAAAEAAAREAVEKARLQAKEAYESNIKDKCASLTKSIIHMTEYHMSTREILQPDELKKRRFKFVNETKKTLKSDLKKCTAFCKKIKSIQSWDMQFSSTSSQGTTAPSCSSSSSVGSMLKDIQSLNLSRYTEEIAQAFLDSKFKVVDIVGVVMICVALHERYSDFMDILLPRIMRVFSSSSSSSSNSYGQKNSSSTTAEEAKQKRIYLRLLVEFLLVGIITDTKSILKILMEATGARTSGNVSNSPLSGVVGYTSPENSSSTSNSYHVTDPNLIVSFVKSAGYEIIGILPKGIQTDVDYLRQQVKAFESVEKQNELENDIQETPSSSIENHEEGLEKDSASHDGTIPSIKEDGTNVSSPTSTSDKSTIESSNNEPTINADVKIMEEAQYVVQRVDTLAHVRSISDDNILKFQKHLRGAYQSLASMYATSFTKLSTLENRCENDRLINGSISEQREKGLQEARKLFENVKKSVESLAEALDESVPVLIDPNDNIHDGISEVGGSANGLEVYKKGEDGHDPNLGPFDDEETRSFYCDIPDLLSTIPAALLGFTPEDVDRIKAANLVKYGSGFDGTIGGDDPSSSSSAPDVVVPDDAKFEDDFIDDKIVSDPTAVDSSKDDDGGENKDTPHYKLMVLIEQELPECNRIDKIDELAEKFCVNHGTSKNSRKRLQKALFLVPRSRIDLLPYYSRLAAIIDRVFPDVASTLLTELEQQFHGLARWKKQQSIENRLRNARFIGELLKFRVAPPIVVLRGIRRCLDDFSGYNIDVACCLLESCGRYLHRTRHTSAKLANLMDAIDRIRKARNLEERSIALINSAFYMVLPPQISTENTIKILTPREAYLKNLLLVQLEPNDKTIAFVSKQILRYPWSDPCIDCGSMVVKYLLKACRKGRYNSITAVAGVISNLRKSKAEIVSRVIDAVLEDLRLVMDRPNIRDQQRTVVYAKLLGELNSRALVSASIVFDQLYDFINYGHEIPQLLREASQNQSNNESATNFTPSSLVGTITQTINEDEEMGEDDEHSAENRDKETPKETEPVAVFVESKYDPRVPSQIDPPTAVFRIKLVCTLLDNSASSLVTPSNYSKLEKFLCAFQRYLFTKVTLPTDIEFSLLDTFDKLDSKLKLLDKDKKRKNLSVKRFKTWVDAHNATIIAEKADLVTQQKTEKRLLTQAGVAQNIHGEFGNNDDLDDSILADDIDESLDDPSIDDEDSMDDLSMSSKESDDSTTEQPADNSMGGDISEDEIEESDDDSDDYDELSYDDDEEEVDEEAAQEAYTRQLEDEAFEQELRRLTMDALERGKISAKTSAIAKVSDTMVSASQFERKKNNKTSSDNTAEAHELSSRTLEGDAGISFMLLKRGNKGKVDSTQFVVPSETNLAKVAAKQDDEAAKERDMLKARVLRYEAESAEQSYTGNVYLDQTRLPEVRNRPLLMEDIDRNFGRSTDFSARSSSSRQGGGGRGSRGGQLWRPGA